MLLILFRTIVLKLLLAVIFIHQTDGSTVLLCPREFFRCNSGECIQYSKFCDGNPDCDDESDEKHCEKCPVNYFQCKNKDCIHDTWVCNSHNDCGDFSDEIHCDTSGSMSERFGNCSEDEFRCHDDHLCIPTAWRCDVDKDCQDGSDEIDCTFPLDNTCQGFLCNHKCIEESQRCDGLVDCDDHSDEINCSSLKPYKDGGVWRCPEDQIACEDGSLCINTTKMCDNVTHCRDGSDEGSGCNVDNCKKKRCAHECIQTPHGPTCLCNHGYELQPDAISCLDIDECTKNDSICSQICTNQPGSFTCSCMEGYKLEEYTNCKAEGPEPILIFSSNTSIRSIHLRSHVHTSITPDGNHLVAVAYDARQERVYWCDVSNTEESIKSSKMDGSNIRTTVWTGLQLPEDLVIDWIAWNLYFTDSGAKNIAVCSLAKDSCSVIIEENLDKPRGIIIEIENRWIFWTDWGHTPYIGRAGMDGSDRQIFVSTMLAWPNGLAIDYVFKRLYWSDAKLQHIERIGFDGKNREVVLGGIAHHPYYLAIFEDTLYYSDWYRHTIESCDKRTGRNHRTLVKEAKKLPIGIHIYHPSLQKNAPNFCELTLCSHQCVLTPNGSFKCLCPAGFVLSQDFKTCIDDVNATFILVAIGHELFKFHPRAIGNNVFYRIDMKTEPTKITDIIYDPVDHVAIMVDPNMLQILALNFTTMETTVLVSKHIRVIGGLALDKFSRNLYWTDTIMRSVIVMSLTTGARTTLMTTESFPTSIALVHKYGYLFVSLSSDSRIIRMNLDGSDQIDLVRVSGSGALGLTVDVIAKRLFWIDRYKEVIKYTTFDGKHSKLMKDDNVASAASMLIYGQRLYWTVARTANIFWSIKTPGYHNFTIPLMYKAKNLRPKLALMTPNLESEVDVLERPNPCEWSPCSHLCLLNQNNYTCACPDDLVLHSNGSCYDFPEATESGFNCNGDHFACEDGQKCLPMPWKCDGTVDCDDKSDEKDCHCKLDQFQCKGNSTLCIPLHWQCDGQEDCPDGSDENCDKVTCNSAEFRCNTGQCISIYLRCDAISECSDGSDEENCKENTCSYEDFRCDSGLCLAQAWVCDQDKDCPGGEDETGPQCNQPTCAPDLFTCDNKYCVDPFFKCNGEDDCGDGSDEKDCPTSSLLPTCPSSTFACLGSSKCIPLVQKCDGKLDCPDGEDELVCGKGCDNNWEYRCNDHECIPKRWVCDGSKDCENGEDEETCGLTTTTPLPTVITCTQYEYRCDNGTCIDLSAVCDKKIDCADGSDESTGCLSFACSEVNGGCSDYCTNTPRGPECSCIEGYKLMKDQKICEDIDECEDDDICSQECYNTFGSYFCYCHYGFHLINDEKTCRAKGETAKLFIAYPTHITSITVDHSQLYVEIKPGNYSITDFDFDVRHQAIYWTDSKTKTINRRLKLSKVEVLVTAENPPMFIAVDWLSTNFYYGDGGRYLHICNTYPRVICVRVITAAFNRNITSVALHPTESFLFYSAENNHLKNGVIVRTYMDGIGSYTIATEKVINPAGLTVDVVRKQVYWVDTHVGHIETCSFYGDKRRTVVAGAKYPVIAIFEEKIYWARFDTDLKEHGDLVFCNKTNCNETVKVYSERRLFKKIMIYHEVQQPKVIGHCEKHQCSHVCASNPEFHTCLCPVGSYLKLFSKTECEDVRQPSTNLNLHNLTINVTINLTAAATDFNVTYSLNCSLICENNGQCLLDDNNTTYCNCLPEFHGERCEQELARLVSNKPHSSDVLIIIITLVLFIVVVVAIVYFSKCSKMEPTMQTMLRSIRHNQVTDQLATIRFTHPRSWIPRRSRLQDTEHASILDQDFSNPAFQQLPTPEEQDAQAKVEISLFSEEDSCTNDTGDTEYLIVTEKTKK